MHYNGFKETYLDKYGMGHLRCRCGGIMKEKSEIERQCDTCTRYAIFENGFWNVKGQTQAQIA